MLVLLEVLPHQTLVLSSAVNSLLTRSVSVGRGYSPLALDGESSLSCLERSRHRSGSLRAVTVSRWLARPSITLVTSMGLLLGLAAPMRSIRSRLCASWGRTAISNGTSGFRLESWLRSIVYLVANHVPENGAREGRTANFRVERDACPRSATAVPSLKGRMALSLLTSYRIIIVFRIACKFNKRACLPRTLRAFRIGVVEVCLLLTGRRTSRLWQPLDTKLHSRPFSSILLNTRARRALQVADRARTKRWHLHHDSQQATTVAAAAPEHRGKARVRVAGPD